MPSPRKRVVITGVGVVSAIANDAATFLSALAEGRRGTRHIQLFDPSQLSCHIACEVPSLPDVPDSVGGFGVAGRPLIMAVSAALEALKQAGIDQVTTPRERRAVVLSGSCTDSLMEIIGSAIVRSGRSLEGLETIEPMELLGDLLATPTDPLCSLHTEVVQGPALAALAGAGQVFNVSTACAGGAQALADGLSMIRNGEADFVLAGGCDSLVTRQMMAGFSKLSALSTRNDDPAAASRPFDADRDGFVMGEGAGMLVLESEESARARGAEILAELAGAGLTCDAYRLTDPRPDGSGMIRSMQRALDDARIEPASLSSINPHGTSTKMNDESESLAIQRVFGDAATGIPISGIKSMIGHLIHGAGAVEAVASVLSIQHETLFPTMNHQTPDPLLGLDFVPNEARQAPVRSVLSNSFGFGGQNASLVFARYAG